MGNVEKQRRTWISVSGELRGKRRIVREILVGYANGLRN
jgi:hypothetical protein